ncbi:MAG: ATPase, T2SS/T4P/T4SS family [Smithellaceae bacterium]|nr:ATPase, T2SS/T4P/T4SS family [Smithellaceae bacterium]
MKTFEDLINIAVSKGYSDIHLTGGMPFVYRKEGKIHFDQSPPWNYRDVDKLVMGMITPRQLTTLRNNWSVDVALTVNRVRMRINIFYTTRGLSLAIRILPEVIPTIESLNLHPSLHEVSKLKSGLVLICGATGTGKTTTLSALVEKINRLQPVHIITLEDPIEYRFPQKAAFIEQREIGIHVPSFKQGLMDLLRENPDVVVVGELRDIESIRLTLSVAESGHLVFATLHATDVEDAITRLSGAATSNEGQDSMRYKIAAAINWFIIQEVVHFEHLGFRLPVLSILHGTPSIRSMIRENKLTQIETAMHTGKNEGMFTFERYIEEFINTRDRTTAKPYSMRRNVTSEPVESDYKSSLIDPNAHQNIVYMSAVEKPEPTPIISPPDDLFDSKQYVIDEEVDLKDLIDQLDDPGNKS